MALQIVAMTLDHAPDAAALVGAGYRRLCHEIPELPPRYGRPEVLEPMLAGLVNAAPGFVAIDGGRLVGCLAGVTLPSFKGRRAVFCPEWAHVAEGGAHAIEERLYVAAARAWADDGCACHLIAQLAGDRAALDAWFLQGLGGLTMDALRDVRPPDAPPVAAGIRRATPDDLDGIVALERALGQHLRASPVFLAWGGDDEGQLRAQLADERIAFWLAEEAGEAVAFIRIGPASEDACGIIMDEGTASITGAYALPRVRRHGVAAAVLRASVAWAAEQGYVRCGVDCETANIEGRRFWTRHFTPICYGLMRCVDEAAVGAPESGASQKHTDQALITR